jgi:hypothetical protein
MDKKTSRLRNKWQYILREYRDS